MIVIYDTQVQSDIISICFFIFFLNIDFFGCYGGKREKNNLKLPISVYFALCLKNCRSYH